MGHNSTPKSNTRSLSVTTRTVLYTALTLTVPADCSTYGMPGPTLGPPPPCSSHPCEHTQGTLGSNEVVGKLTCDSCLPSWAQAVVSSLLNRFILRLMFGGSTRSPTVFITLPTNYSQLLNCLQVSFVALLIIPQHNLGASTF